MKRTKTSSSTPQARRCVSRNKKKKPAPPRKAAAAAKSPPSSSQSSSSASAPPAAPPATQPVTAKDDERRRVRLIVEKYIRDVDTGKIIAGELVIRAVRRHLWDLKHRNDLRHHFDDAAACRVIRYFSLLRHWRGKWVGQPFELSPWQMFIVWVLFGWKRKDGTRRFRVAYILVAKKNGKSPFIAGLGLYLLTSDGEAGADIFSAATKKDQARIIVTEATMLSRKTPALANRLIYTPALKGRNAGGKFVSNITYVAGASKIEVLSKDSDTQDGLNVYGGLVDEVHAAKDRGMWDQLAGAMGARTQPMLIGITTAGLGGSESIGGDLLERAERALEGFDKDGGVVDDTYFAFIAAASKEDDPYVESTWRKANPNLGVSVSLNDIAEQAAHAKQFASARPDFLRKRLNIWLQAESAWIDLAKWDACKAPLPAGAAEGTPPYTLDDLIDEGWECWGAFDLAAKIDLNAFVALFRRDGRYRLLPWFWMPKETALERRLREPMYGPWIDEKLIFLTPGAVADYDFLEERIADVGTRAHVIQIMADPWNFTQVGVHLRDQRGFVVEEFRQGVASYNEPCREFERLILGRLIEHDGNPVLRWMIGNVAVHTDAAGNIKPIKPDHKSAKKIDGAACAIMALGAAIAGDGEGELDDIPFVVAGGR